MAVGIALENWSYSAMSLMSGRFSDHNSISANAVMYQLWSVVWAFYWGWGLALQVACLAVLLLPARRLGQHRMPLPTQSPSGLPRTPKPRRFRVRFPPFREGTDRPPLGRRASAGGAACDVPFSGP